MRVFFFFRFPGNTPYPVALVAALMIPVLFSSGCASVFSCVENTPAATMNKESKSKKGDDMDVRRYHPVISISGRLSVHYQQNDQDAALHGSFDLQQKGENSHLSFLSPLGQTIATLAMTPDGAQLTESGKPSRTADDVDALVVQTLGWPLPVAGLRQWLQGFAVDAHHLPFVASHPNSTVTTEDGWHIRYANWQPDGHARRLDLTRETQEAGKVHIRIVIDHWQPQQDNSTS